jgi:hypothetical protein
MILAEDAAGTPVGGLYVWTGDVANGSFFPSHPLGRTGAHGRLTVPCQAAPVVLIAWPLGTSLDAADLGSVPSLVPAMVGVAPGGVPAAPPCGAEATHTRLVAGAPLQVSVPTCDPATPDVLLVTPASSYLAVSLRIGVLPGTSFSVPGLPVGSTTLQLGEATSTALVSGSGDAVTLDCPQPSPTSEPAASETP